MQSRVRSSVRVAAALAVLLASAGLARADFTIPPTDINSLDANGTAFVVTGGTLNADAVLSLSASGIVNLNDKFGPFLVNAAGVVISDGGAYSNPTASVFTYAGGLVASAPFGALLIGNSTLGFVQLFADNVVNGFGASAPSSTLSVTATLGSLFGAGVVLTDHTKLFIVVNDSLRSDNAGSFNVSGGIGISVSSVPEPASIALMGLGSVALIGFRLRRRRAA
jgi:hypothetical protein